MEEQGGKAVRWVRANKLKSFLLASVVLVSFVIILVICIKQNEDMNQFKVESVSLYTWFNKEMLSYDDATLTFDRSGTVTKLTVGNESYEAENMPYFYKDKREVLFPYDMNIVQPKLDIGGRQSRLPSLAIIDGTYAYPIVEFADFNETIGDAFLYDGNDLYFFINPVTLYKNGEAIELPEFSFVTYNFNKELYVYRYGSDAEYYEGVEELKAEAQDYRVDLVAGVLTSGDKSQLLVKRIGDLETIK